MAIACVACVNGHDGDQYMRYSGIEVVIDKHDTSAEQKKNPEQPTPYNIHNNTCVIRCVFQNVDYAKCVKLCKVNRGSLCLFPSGYKDKPSIMNGSHALDTSHTLFQNQFIVYIAFLSRYLSFWI